MKTEKLSRYSLRWVAPALLLVLLLLFSLSAGVAAAKPLQPDPTADIPWTGPETFAGIVGAFNNARTVENTQLGLTWPPIVMPFTEAQWFAMSDDERALWLIQQERAVRGDPLMEGWEPNVAAVAQTYADWMVANNLWGHYVDGHDPAWRMTQNAAINACNDGYFGENLAIFAGGSARAIPIALSIYMWMYEDTASAWGHRHLILANYGGGDACLAGQEGYLGIGHAGAAGYDPLSWGYPYGETVVMDTFDPCGTWSTCGQTAVGLSCFETAPVEGVGTLVGLVCLGMLAGAGVVTQHRRSKG